MYAYSVMVLAKGKQPESLTYFGSTKIAPFSRVIVPLRKKDVRGIVTGSAPLAQVKGEIKTSDFALRKIKKIVGGPLFQNGYIEALQSVAEFYAINENVVFTECIAAPHLEYASGQSEDDAVETTDSKRAKLDSILLTGTLTDRVGVYKTLIREAFAKGQSLYICVPTLDDAAVLYSHLSIGIEKYSYEFHSGHTPARVRKDIAKLLASDHPTLVIGTVSYLALPLRTIGRVVLEHETSQSYMSIGSAGVDLREVVYAFAKHSCIPLVVADTYVSVSAYKKMQDGELVLNEVSTFRLPAEKQLTVVDMKSPEEKGGGIIGSTLETRILETLKRGQDVFLFALKDGLASHIVCQDCGTPQLCTVCKGALGLEHAGNQTNFWCKKCKREYSSLVTCTACNSWKLKELGVTIGKVESEVRKLFPNAPVHTIGALDEKKDRAKLSSLAGTGGVIYLGTPRALARLPERVDLSAVVSFDALLFYPHYAIGERILSLIASLYDSAKSELLIQTRDASFPLLQYMMRGNLGEWYSQELALRKKYAYPPYVHMIELVYHTSSIQNETEFKETLSRQLAPYEPVFVQSKAKQTLSVSVRIPTDFYTPANARTHPLRAILLEAKKNGAAVLWNKSAL